MEPFAGSARYALRYWEHDVCLLDPSEHVYQVWKYLLEASERDILDLPLVPSKIHLDEYKSLTDAERYLIGFHLCRGKAKPRKVGHGQNSWAQDRARIAADLYKIKHWKIEQRSYTDLWSLPNYKATYFIDPPYKAVQTRAGNSDRYEHWLIDYNDLARFARSRAGQVIVCEGEGGDWLPFKHLAVTNANTNAKSVKRNNEYIYTQER